MARILVIATHGQGTNETIVRLIINAECEDDEVSVEFENPQVQLGDTNKQCLLLVNRPLTEVE